MQGTFTRNAGASLAPADAPGRLPIDRRTALHWLEWEDSMGRIGVETTIEDGTDAAFNIRCAALLDTEVAYPTLPNAWRDRLARLTRLDAVDVQVANQAIVTGEICGPVLLRMERFRPVLTEVLSIDMAHGPYEPPIRYIPPEQPHAAVDPMAHRLFKESCVNLQ